MSKESNHAKTASEAAKSGPGRPQKNAPGMVRINVQVELAGHTKLKVFCAKNNTTITDLIRKLIDDLPV